METRHASALSGWLPPVLLILMVLIYGSIPAFARGMAHEPDGAAAASVRPDRPRSAPTTDLSGSISRDTTWTRDDSPCVVTGDHKGRPSREEGIP